MFIAASGELGLPSDVVLKAMKPKYGIIESGLQLYKKYLNHHVGRLGMERSKFYPCLLMQRVNGKETGIIVLKVDEGLGIGTKQFLDEEKRAAASFKSKPRSILTT